MLISQDLLKFLSVGLSPAQLCLIRVMGTDNAYVFRVRHGTVHLDYPVQTPLLDTATQIEDACNWDLVHDQLIAMARLVVPPGVTDSDFGSLTRRAGVQVLHPMPWDEFKVYGC